MSDFVYQNAALLMQHHPAAAKRMQEHLRVQRENKSTSVYQTLSAKNGQPTLLYTAHHPSVYLHSPDNPALETLKQIQPALNQQPERIVLYSLGLGYALHALRSWIASHKLIIIEPDEDVLMEFIRIANWQVVLSSSQIHFFTGKDAVQDAVQLFKLHPSLLRPNVQIIMGRNELPSDAMHLELLRNAVHNPTAAITVKEEPYALVCSDAHESLLQPMIHEAQTANLLLRGIHRPAYINRFLSGDEIWRETLGEPLPQQLLSFSKNALRQDEWNAIANTGVRCQVWCYDDPFRGDVNEMYFKGLQRIFCYDPHITKKLQTLSPVPVSYMPAATAFSHFMPQQCKTYTNETWDITFVGSTGLQRHDDALVQAINNHALFFQQLNTIVASNLENGERVSYDDAMAMTVDGINIPSGSLNSVKQDAFTFLVRKYFLSVLKGLPLVIFGDRGWSEPAWVGELTSRYAGTSLKYAEESPYVYANSKINLNLFNIQCVNSPTIRMFDVMACGGFLLTEYRPFMDEFFCIGEQLDVFRTPDELADKAQFYLLHDEARMRIAKAGQEFVLNHHRYRHRLPLLFQ